MKQMKFAVVMALAGCVGGAALAQATGGTVHGHVQNAVGQAITSGDVKLTTDRSPTTKDSKFPVSLPIGKDGNYKGPVPLGDYVAYVVQDGKYIDRLQIVVKAGDDKTLDFDMTRAEYLNAMTPEGSRGHGGVQEKERRSDSDKFEDQQPEWAVEECSG